MNLCFVDAQALQPVDFVGNACDRTYNAELSEGFSKAVAVVSILAAVDFVEVSAYLSVAVVFVYLFFHQSPPFGQK